VSDGGVSPAELHYLTDNEIQSLVDVALARLDAAASALSDSETAAAPR
jgi:hypothetical protein